MTDTRQMAHFLYQTRNGYYRDGYLAESEPDADDDSESFLGVTDSESEFGGEIYPRTVHACDRMEVEGEDVGGDDIAAGMVPAEGSDDDEVVRPARHVRNVFDSDSDGEPANEDGGAEVSAVQPPGTMVVFDELAPGDATNPCEFSLHW